MSDEIAIIGRYGENQIIAQEMMAQLETISYAVACGISEIVPRIYKKCEKS